MLGERPTVLRRSRRHARLEQRLEANHGRASAGGSQAALAPTAPHVHVLLVAGAPHGFGILGLAAACLVQLLHAFHTVVLGARAVEAVEVVAIRAHGPLLGLHLADPGHIPALHGTAASLEVVVLGGVEAVQRRAILHVDSDQKSRGARRYGLHGAPRGGVHARAPARHAHACRLNVGRSELCARVGLVLACRGIDSEGCPPILAVLEALRNLVLGHLAAALVEGDERL
mmetsp:Transcript_95509/g.308007  ORF Transcript_95509/g.308007 Transcript_95509/m.308007 type:complete len:229 (-) Transcript_95509:1275-1961(-)